MTELSPTAAIRSMNESGADSQYITSFVAAAAQHGWTGLNVDWEGKNTSGTRAGVFSRRREFCHSAATPSPFSRRFDRDDEVVPAKMTASPTATPIETSAKGRGGVSKNDRTLADGQTSSAS